MLSSSYRIRRLCGRHSHGSWPGIVSRYIGRFEKWYDANDLLQNTFLKAWGSIEYFRGDAKLSTWLYRIAVNEALTFLARERERRNLTADDTDDFLLSHVESDEYFDGDRAQRLLQEAVLQLPEKQRLVFNMRYFDEMKYEDMSEILGTSVGALKASYHHAAKKIEEYLQDHV